MSTEVWQCAAMSGFASTECVIEITEKYLLFNHMLILCSSFVFLSKIAQDLWHIKEYTLAQYLKCIVFYSSLSHI